MAPTWLIPWRHCWNYCKERNHSFENESLMSFPQYELLTHDKHKTKSYPNFLYDWLARVEKGLGKSQKFYFAYKVIIKIDLNFRFPPMPWSVKLPLRKRFLNKCLCYWWLHHKSLIKWVISAQAIPASTILHKLFCAKIKHDSTEKANL